MCIYFYSKDRKEQKLTLQLTTTTFSNGFQIFNTEAGSLILPIIMAMINLTYNVQKKYFLCNTNMYIINEM